MMSTRMRKPPPLLPLVWLVPPLAWTIIFDVTSPNEISLVQSAAAFAVACAPWWSYLQWRKSKSTILPLFSLVTMAYWVYFAFPLFWGDRQVANANSLHLASEDSITQVMLMVALGIIALSMGFKSGLGQHLGRESLPDVAAESRKWDYLRFLLIGGALFSLYEPGAYLFGEEGRQLMLILQRTIPYVAFVMLLRNFFEGKAIFFDKLLLVAFVAVGLSSALSSGWVGSVTSFIAILGSVYFAVRKRIPLWAAALVVILGLFLFAGRGAYRGAYWYGGAQGDRIERMQFWLDQSVKVWRAALGDPGNGTLRNIIQGAVSRVSLLTQSVNVLELTPSVVPFQNGQTYSYLFMTWIPRFVWPDKPSINDANRFYQVAYGLTAQQNLGSVSIAVGVLTEAYLNFGWIGVVVIMFLVGLFIYFFEQTFLRVGAGLLPAAIGLVLLPNFLILESQLAQYVAGIPQQIIVGFLVFLPMWRTKPRSDPSNDNSRFSRQMRAGQAEGEL